MINKPTTIQQVMARGSITMGEEVEQPQRDSYLLTIYGSENYEQCMVFHRRDLAAQENLYAALYLLTQIFAKQEQYYTTTSENPTKEQIFGRDNDMWRVQQNIIWEEGKDIFLKYQPLKPICCLFPMDEERVAEEFPQYFDNQLDAETQLLEDTALHEWPYEDGSFIIIHSYDLRYWGPDGEELTCTYELADNHRVGVGEDKE